MENYKKKYENALEIARKINNGDGVPAPPDYTICEVIFPELKESDDEKIIKEIIQFLQLPHPQFVGKRNYEEWISWLKKQKELKKIEQKSSWSEEDEKYFNVIYKELESYIAIKGYYTPLSCADLSWLKSLKDRVQSQLKQEWSEEDDKMIRGLIVICDEWTTRHSFYPIENCEIEKLKNWLESLKERMKGK